MFDVPLKVANKETLNGFQNTKHRMPNIEH
jgi:hypothetical protein